MNYNYKHGQIICSTPHGDLYWLYDSGEEHYGITETGHHYRRNDTYGYYYIKQINITFKAKSLRKYQWRSLIQVVLHNDVNLFERVRTTDKSFGYSAMKDLSEVEIDFDKFMDFLMTKELFEAFKLLFINNSGNMTQRYKWTGRIKPYNNSTLTYKYVPGINGENTDNIKLEFFIGDGNTFITTLILFLDDNLIFEYNFNHKTIKDLTYDKFYEILEKELKER